MVAWSVKRCNSDVRDVPRLTNSVLLVDKNDIIGEAEKIVSPSVLLVDKNGRLGEAEKNTSVPDFLSLENGRKTTLFSTTLASAKCSSLASNQEWRTIIHVSTFILARTTNSSANLLLS